MSAQRNTVLVVGAASQVGYHLLPMLASAGFEVAAISRRDPPRDARGAAWYRVDLSKPDGLSEIGLEPWSAISLAPISILPDLIVPLGNIGVRRIIAFSSTSIFTKAKSADPKERELVETLERSEAILADECERRAIAWTVFRPTLIYSAGLDRNVSEIAQVIQRFRVFPIVGEGRGLRQPVHAADLAGACVTVLREPRAFNKAYNLTGGQTLSYREMVQEIFRGLGRRPRILPVPLVVYKTAVRIARILPRFRKLSSELATRMNQDLVFEHNDATLDFGYAPRKFEFTLPEAQAASLGDLRSGFAR